MLRGVMGRMRAHDGRYVLFFQAEDGLRGAQESRGLGDVYKGQVHAVLQVFRFSENAFGARRFNLSKRCLPARSSRNSLRLS